jgi:hypothetical protein
VKCPRSTSQTKRLTCKLTKNVAQVVTFHEPTSNGRFLLDVFALANAPVLSFQMN